MDDGNALSNSSLDYLALPASPGKMAMDFTLCLSRWAWLCPEPKTTIATGPRKVTMPEQPTTAARLAALVERVLGEPLVLRLRAWDDSEAGAPDGPTLVLQRRRALRRLLWSPNEVGLGRAYVSGDLMVEGDLYEALDRLSDLAKRASVKARLAQPRARAEMLLELASLGVLGLAPASPPEESRPRGAKHSLGRDQEAASHHYDVGNDFYRIAPGESMVYSCAYWTCQDPRMAYTQRRSDLP
jgi:cyclopropane-fatty-acyl-phospholipid synthase